MKILVSFDSYWGHTEKLAKAVADGASKFKNTEVRLLKASETQEADLEWASAIIIGCPTHMGTGSWQMKKMLDTAFSSAWMKSSLSGKVGGVFATGGSGGAGGAELALVGLLSTLAQNGMILVTLPRNAPGYKPDGMHWGPVWATGGMKDPGPEHIESANYFGERVAKVAAALTGKL